MEKKENRGGNRKKKNVDYMYANKFALGMRAGGAPPMYKTAASLIKEVNKYFEYIQGESEEVEREYPTGKKDEDGEPIMKKETITRWLRQPEPATITGVALFLGFSNRQSFYDMEARAELREVVQRTRAVIENAYEQKLDREKCPGPIFALKQFGWSDQVNQDIKLSGGVTHTIDWGGAPGCEPLKSSEEIEAEADADNDTE